MARYPLVILFIAACQAESMEIRADQYAYDGDYEAASELWDVLESNYERKAFQGPKYGSSCPTGQMPFCPPARTGPLGPPGPAGNIGIGGRPGPQGRPGQFGENGDDWKDADDEELLAHFTKLVQAQQTPAAAYRFRK